MRFVTIEETAAKWGVTPRQVRTYCASGRTSGATLEHGEWRIPEDAVKPERKSRRTFPTTILGVLEAERSSRISGGLYYRLQIDLAYNSNHMEGSRLTHEQTRWIFETKTIGEIGADVSVDDIVETANHFRATDMVIKTAKAALTEAYVKRLHEILKSGTSDSRKDFLDALWAAARPADFLSRRFPEIRGTGDCTNLAAVGTLRVSSGQKNGRRVFRLPVSRAERYVVEWTATGAGARGTITMARADGSRRWDLPVVTSRGEGSFRHLVRIPPDVGLLVFAMHADGGGEVEFSDIGAYLLPAN